MSKKETLLEFPCRYSAKAFGERDEGFIDVVFELAQRHIHDLEKADLSHKSSSTGRYTSVTVTFIARSKKQLDGLYQDFTDHPAVIMSL